MPTLKDIVRPNLPLIFIGINPGRHSARAGHHYAGPGNLFWPLLHESGLVPERLTAFDDHRLPEFGIGLLNIVDRTTPGSADLSPGELEAGARRLLRKLGRLRPRVVCFNGKIVHRAVARLPDAIDGSPGPAGGRIAGGFQAGRLAGARVFVMPSTSPRAAVPRSERLRLFRALKQGVDPG